MPRVFGVRIHEVGEGRGGFWWPAGGVDAGLLLLTLARAVCELYFFITISQGIFVRTWSEFWARG